MTWSSCLSISQNQAEPEHHSGTLSLTYRKLSAQTLG